MSGAPLLSAAIIVRDEAEHLRECLRSLDGLVDEIVVVDTGSTDCSDEVARVHGAVVIHRPWDDDFSAARNAGLDRAVGKWILYIDADERVEQTDVHDVRATLEHAEDVAGFMVNLAVRVGWTPFREHRMWRHDPEVRFWGRMHESIVPSLERCTAATGRRVAEIPVSITHYGYEGDLTAKHERNLPLLQAQLELDPHRVYLWNELGVTLSALGERDRAMDAWRRGMELIREHGCRTPVDILCAGSLAVATIDGGDDASGLLDEIEALDPRYPMVWWARARHDHRDGRWTEALESIDRLVAHEASPSFGALSFRPSLFREWAWELAGDCWVELDEYERAVSAYERALAWRPGDLRYRTKALGAAAAGRSLNR